MREAALLGAALLCGCTGCSSGESSTAPGAAAGAGSAAGVAGSGTGGKGGTTGKSGTGGTTGGTAGAAGNGAGGGPPAGLTIPDDWKSFKWSDKCTVRYTVKGSTMPPGISWQSCLPGAPEGVGCKLWQEEHYKVGTPPSLSRFFQRLPDGRSVMQTFRVAKEGGYSVNSLLDTDGNVVHAVANEATANETCVIYNDLDLADGKWAVQLAEGPYIQEGYAYRGGIGGDASDGEVAMSYRNKFPPSSSGNGTIAAVSSSGIIDSNGEKVLYDWAGNPPVHFYSAKDDPDGLPGYDVVSIKGVSFVQVNAGGLSGIDKWEDGKVTPFLRAPGDYNKAYGDFGTDGIDMVWTYGEVKVPGKLYSFAKQDIVTAPYTPDSVAALGMAKRLRSILTPMSPMGWRVGCGYAALAEYPPADGAQGIWLRVVRLSDGVSWKVAGADGQYAMTVIGLTCDHMVVGDPANRLMRFDMAAILSLPSEPPD